MQPHCHSERSEESQYLPLSYYQRFFGCPPEAGCLRTTLLNNLTLIIFALFQSDGEFGADYLAKAAAQALVRVCYRGQGITFGAQFLAHFESFPGAKLYAVAAALTSLPVYQHLPGPGSFLLVVEGLSP